MQQLKLKSKWFSLGISIRLDRVLIDEKIDK